MRVKFALVAMAALIAAPLPAQAFLYSPRHNHRGYYPPPPPNIATDKAYDRALIHYRVHGRWPDGLSRAPLRRGQIASLAIAQRAPLVDWRAAGLYAPKSGYRWRKIGGDYVMVGDVSRLIAAIVLPTG